MKTIFLLLFSISSLNIAIAQQVTSGPVPAPNTYRGIVGRPATIKQVVNKGVPAYLWRHGCGPTALGMIIGYYDLHGFPDLIEGEDTTQTDFVNAALASEEHYQDYSLPLDNSDDIKQDKSSTGDAHESNCIADFMFTSWSAHHACYGWSYTSNMAPAFENYVRYKNESYLTETGFEYLDETNLKWFEFKYEIDAGRPVALVVDTDGDGSTDHFVTGIGYDIQFEMYAVYDTWDKEIHWFDWRPMRSGREWGIYGFTTFKIEKTTSVGHKEDLVDFQIYPNPARDYLKINCDYSSYSIDIYNLYSEKVFSGNSVSIIDLSEFASGIYLCVLKSDRRLTSNRFAIIR